MKTTRQIVTEALCKMDKADSWSNLTMDSLIEKYHFDARDAAFAGALFYGVIERRITLDACIAANSKTALAKLDSAVLNTLRLAVYQLLYMDGVPDHAAVDESVELVRHLRKAQAAGFVNAVLRSFLRSGKAVPIPASPLSARLSMEYSCPEPLVSLWLTAYGEEKTRDILIQSLAEAPVSLRVNTLKTTPEKLIELLAKRGVAAATDSELPHCLHVQKQGAVHKLPEYKTGLFHVQDKSSQLCAMALEAKAGDRVLDACAAPGGKAFSIAMDMGNAGELIAADIYPHRVKLIEERARQMGLKCVAAKAADMSIYDESMGTFDRILCDVPCSGLGVIRRRPEIKYKSLEEFSGLPDLQYKILLTASNYCKRGGRLIYSTCTLNEPENGAVTRRFLSENPDFEPDLLPALLGGESERLIFPGEMNGDGFYMAALTRKRG